jgi:DNA-binding CsgD family transcriptional regulator
LLPAEDKDERDRRIIAWSAAGRSTRWIAGRTGITQPRVVQILGKHRTSKMAA